MGKKAEFLAALAKHKQKPARTWWTFLDADAREALDEAARLALAPDRVVSLIAIYKALREACPEIVVSCGSFRNYLDTLSNGKEVATKPKRR